MAADLLARGLAAQARAAQIPPLARLADLSAIVVPATSNAIAVGTGAAAASYVADSRANAALAAAHPLCCRADAAGRYFRLDAREGAIDFAHTGLTGAGGNMRPAVQAAIAYACAMDIRSVENRGGIGAFELWTPLRTTGPSNYLATDGQTLVVQGATRLHLDFGGARITLKGPTGLADRSIGQPNADWGYGVQPWLGGWLYIVGSDSLEEVSVANAEVFGNFSCPDFQSNSYSNITSKGIWIQDTHVGRIRLKDLYCHHFSGEVCYLAASRSSSGGAVNYHVENCKFEYSPQSAFNPNGNGRLTAINLQAGHAYSAIESIGGEGQDWLGCRFYEAGQTYFHGGPDPTYQSGYYYTYPIRRTNAAPPFITFHDTQFENVGSIQLTNFARGTFSTVDSTVLIAGDAPGDISLEIESWCDRANFIALELSSSAVTPTTQASNCPAGIYYRPPANMDIRVTCKRTALAQENGRKHSLGARIYAGALYDYASIRVAIGGEATEAWDIFGPGGAGFGVPLMVTEPDFQQLAYTTGYDYFTGDKSYKVAWGTFTLFPTADGTSHITLDNTYAYAHGQEVVFRNWSNNAARITSFAKNGAGLCLNADRTQRRFGEFLRLKYNAAAGKWCEVGCLDQGA